MSSTADPAENQKPDRNQGHAQENIGLQSAATATGNDHPKIGSAIGKRSTADSTRDEKSDPSLAREIGVGVQNVAGNLGSGVSKIGAALARQHQSRWISLFMLWVGHG